jgi:hypothetical protein
VKTLTALAIGLVGAGALIAGFAIDPQQAAFAYLTAWTCAVSLALGAMIFLMSAYAIDARWPTVFRGFAEGMVRTLPLLALGFIPVALTLPRLYPWVDPAPALGAEMLRKLAHAAPWDNVPTFVVRGAILLLVWCVLGELMVRWARRPELRYRLRALSAASLPALGITLTIAAFDWLMTLTPGWYSTIFGLMYFAGGFVGALALIAVMARLARRDPRVAEAITRQQTGALGRLVLAFVAFWAYKEFAQGVIIWIANKPGEVPWYVARGAGQWGAVLALLVIGHFIVPFFLLLARPITRDPTRLAIVSAWLVLMHYVDAAWLVMPSLHAQPEWSWIDLAAPAAVFGLAAAFALARGRGAIPSDPWLREAEAYEEQE